MLPFTLFTTHSFKTQHIDRIIQSYICFATSEAKKSPTLAFKDLLPVSALMNLKNAMTLPAIKNSIPAREIAINLDQNVFVQARPGHVSLVSGRQSFLFRTLGMSAFNS